MDAIMDLTARAVSFITLIQDTFSRGGVISKLRVDDPGLDYIFNKNFKNSFKQHITTIKAEQKLRRQNEEQEKFGKDPDHDKGDEKVRFLTLENKVIELVWFSSRKPQTEDLKTAEEYTIQVSDKLCQWITRNGSEVERIIGSAGAFAPPYLWRKAIATIAYAEPKERVELAEALEYLPIHIVLALGGGPYDVQQQRILQWLDSGEIKTKLPLAEKELKLHQKFKQSIYDDYKKLSPVDVIVDKVEETYTKIIAKLLKSSDEVRYGLLANDAPLSFDYVFAAELKEINESRVFRRNELLAGRTGTAELPKEERKKENETERLKTNPPNHHNSPADKAANMKLFALAFSGGGIRSATFNLGILQGLAKKGIISNIDYLSTVSGGGYIGSWLSTWIKRNGSVTKVSDRLNPEQSPDPMGEEVRPIRWLRMFSNYFTPNKSIMSDDSWTVGVTWIRNMLLNQVIILLLFLTVFLLGNIIFKGWLYLFHWTDTNNIKIDIAWNLVILLVALLAAYGMNSYQSKPLVSFSKPATKWIYRILIAVAITGAFSISAWLYSRDVPPHDVTPLQHIVHRLYKLLPQAFTIFAALVMIAYLGGYHHCINSFITREHKSSLRSGWDASKSLRTILFSAAVSALAGAFCLGATWELLQFVKGYCFIKNNRPLPEDYNDAIAFTVGVPLILVVFGVTVVVRMALLGKFFPDERREWWGRMGAIINKIGLMWLLLAGAALLGRDIIKVPWENWPQRPTTFFGWITLVASSVRAAYSSKTGSKSEANGWQGKIYNILGMAGPYIFMLGLLIFIPTLLTPLTDIGSDIITSTSKRYGFKLNIDENQLELLTLSLLVLLFGITTWRMSTRVGVNEFSMHHFYRNRLVRAYLGATRRKSSREKTANPFTGFDMADDEKLSKYTNAHGYFGPYPVLNTALNATQFSELDRQDRKAESFIFSPLYCGFDFSRVRSSATVTNKSYDYGFRPTGKFAYPNDNGPGIGTAMAISGAAINPNQGYHSSPGTAFLLTVFNVQMGWWIGNPRKGKWGKSDPDFGLGYIISSLVGQTNTRNNFVSLSDGGHFDNMGLYEMVRRRCTYIILCDGEQDENFTCEGFANAIRRCRIDFGAEIEIKIDDIVTRDENRHSKSHYAVGTIKYHGDEKPTGCLVYIKSSITGEEPVDVAEYAAKNETFPHQTTADQFFDEEQFESYRKLGLHIADTVLADEDVLKCLGLDKEHSLMERIESKGKDLLDGLKTFIEKKMKGKDEK